MPEILKKDEGFVLAVDLGTSGPKSALISTRGEMVDYEFEEIPLYLLPKGGAEQNPEEWWQAVMNTARKVIGRGTVRPELVEAVCCTSQWSGTVPVDDEGNNIMNAIIWMDSRGAGYIRDITKGFISFNGYGLSKLMRWLHLTGGAPELSGKGPIAHILFLKNEMRDIYERTHKFLEPKDYMNLKFSGEMAASFDSIALHWLTDNRDVSRVVYNDSLVKMSTISKEKLPRLKRAVDILGTVKGDVADELGLRRDVAVITGTPDIHSAAIGSGAVRDYEGHLYLGTSSWLTCHVPFKKTDIFHNIASLPSAIPGKYFVANEQETAGACLTFLRDNMMYCKDEILGESELTDIYKIFDSIAEKIPAGSNKVIFTPWLYGERTPVENGTVRACLFNQSLNTTRDHMIRAVFEGVAFNGRWLLGYVEKFIRRRLDPINVIGGGANSDIWCQIHADVFDRTIKQVRDPIQANLRGAAFLAGVALGRLNFDEIPGLVKVGKVYRPDMENRRIYNELFGEFLNIYKCNRKIYSRLNRYG